MLPAADGPDQPYSRSLKVDPAQVVIVAFAHHDCGRVFVGVMAMSAGIETLPVDDQMFSDGLFPFAETLLMTGDPGGGSADDVVASTPYAAIFAGERLRDDGS